MSLLARWQRGVDGREKTVQEGKTELSFMTKTDALYGAIKAAILSGEVSPDSRLGISDLAEHYGVSEIPVREALRKLETQGLVTMIPHAGARVTKLSLPSLEEVMLIRGTLEALAASRAATSIDCDQIERVRGLNDQMKQVASDSPYEFGEMNKRFHLAIYEACPLKRLVQLIRDLWVLADSQHMRAVFAYAPDRMKIACQEHVAIIAALDRRDDQLVERLMRMHKQGALDAMRKQVQRMNELQSRDTLDKQK